MPKGSRLDKTSDKNLKQRDASKERDSDMRRQSRESSDVHREGRSASKIDREDKSSGSSRMGEESRSRL